MIQGIDGIRSGIWMQAVNYNRTAEGGDFSEELRRASLRAMNPEYEPEDASAYQVKSQSQGILSDAAEKAEKVLAEGGDYNPVTLYDEYFEAAAKKYNVPVSLLKSVAKIESNFTDTAVSGSGAMGVMQLMPGTAKALGVDDAFDAEQNIYGGAKYLASSLNEFDGDVSLALAAYNAGGGAVRRAGGVPSQAVQDYVDAVLGYYQS